MFFAQDLMPGWLKRGTDIANSFDRLDDTWFDWSSSKDRVEKNTQKTNDWFGGDDSWGGMTDTMKTAATVAVDAAEGPENTGDLFAIGNAWGQEQDLEKKSQISKDFAASAATLVGKKPKKDKDSADAAGRIYNIALGNNALDQQGMDWSWENLPSFSTEQKPEDTLTGGKADDDLAGGSQTDNLLTEPLPPKDENTQSTGSNQKSSHALAYTDIEQSEESQDKVMHTLTDILHNKNIAPYADGSWDLPNDEPVPLEELKPGSNIRENHNNYKRIHENLDNPDNPAINQSKWYKAAAEVTGYDAVGAADLINGGFITDEEEAYLRFVHHGLAEPNHNTYHLIRQGKEVPGLEGLRGKERDYALVEREQLLVEELTQQFFAQNPDISQDYVMDEINQTNDPTIWYSPINLGAANKYVRDAIKLEFPDGTYDHRNIDHRIRLGQAMVDMAYNEESKQ